MNNRKRYIYLDHAAATPLDPRVERAMAPYGHKHFENPSALYAGSVKARRAIEDARFRVAAVLHVRASEIVFIPGGTAGNNLAMFGVVRAHTGEGRNPGHIIVSAIEHESVLEPARMLEQEGYAVTRVMPDRDGIIAPESVQKALRPDTILISIMYANNEVGTVQPVREIAKVIRDFKKATSHKPRPTVGIPASPDQKNGTSGLPATSYPYLHTDACQAANYLDLNAPKLGVDLLTLNGSKIYGPKMSGCLYVRRGVPIRPVIMGGGQEAGLWSGTENVAGVIGFAEGLQIASAKRVKESTRLTELRDYFIARVHSAISGMWLNGSATQRLPNNIHVSLRGVDGVAAALYLDASGVACAVGSACTTHSDKPSHVLRAMRVTERRAKSSLRFTMGRSTTRRNVDYVIRELRRIIPLIKH